MTYKFNRKLFEKIVRKDQKELKRYLKVKIEELGYATQESDGWLFGTGKLPVLLVAHMDTVHKKQVTDIYYSKGEAAVTAVEGIGGDDRCGVYMALELARVLHCHLLFTEDEEVGCVGARKFASLIPPALEQKNAAKKDLLNGIKYIVQFDRKNAKDAVFYNCDNKEFTEMVLRYGFTKEWGSYSDISEVAPALGVAAVNLSCGYYNPHTTNEYIRINEMLAQMERATEMIIANHDKAYEYVACKYSWYGYGYGGGWYDKWGYWEDDEFDDVYSDSRPWKAGKSVIQKKLVWLPNVIKGGTLMTAFGEELALDEDYIADLYLSRNNEVYEYIAWDNDMDKPIVDMICGSARILNENGQELKYDDEKAEFVIISDDYYSDALSEEEELELKEDRKEAK